MKTHKAHKAKQKSALRYSRLKRNAKRFYYRFLRIRGAPKQIALGVALGIFVGMTPFLGLHTVIAVLLAAAFKWSKIGAGAGVLITNPFTAPLIYPFTYNLGAYITGFSDPSQWLRIFDEGGVVSLIKDSPMIIVDLVVGGMIIGLPLAVAFYYLTWFAVLRTRNRLERRKALRMAKRAALLRKYKTKGIRKKADRAA